jgi:hypothetical protein
VVPPRTGVYPGSFNPPTIAHLAVAEAALRQCRLDRLDLVLSRDPLGKEGGDLHPIEERLRVLEAVAGRLPGLGVRVSDARLLVDLAAGADVLVLGADKWAQLHDPAWYGGSSAARDECLARLAGVTIAVAPRPPHALPDVIGDNGGTGRVVVLEVAAELGAVSASAVRRGRHDWALREAAGLLVPRGDHGATRSG